MKKFSLFLLVFILAFAGFAQDSDLYRNVINELASAKYYGRAYYKEGDKKAAGYIEKQFTALGAKPVNNAYTQEFSFPVNTFPGKMSMYVDGKKLEAGKDFVMREFSSGIKGEYGLYYIDTANYDIKKVLADLEKPENKNSLIVVDFMFFQMHGEELGQFYKSERPGYIMIWDMPLKYYKAYSAFTVPVADIWVSSDFPRDAKSVKVDIKNVMIKDYKTSNVIAYVEGKHAADSFYVFTAHYDHIGVMGKKVYAPGANDNASGVAMLVSLAEHYAKPENQPACSMMFIATAGEETGLRGASHFVENPLVSLDKIKYVINCDMIADNSEDIYVEISEPGQKGLDLFNEINNRNSYFTKLDQGELEGNSDHYPFAEKGIPAIFFMMKGDAFKIYHTPQDDTENIYLGNFPKLFSMIKEFVERY